MIVLAPCSGLAAKSMDRRTMVPKITLPRAERQVEKTRTVDRAARAVITPVLDPPSGTGRRLLRTLEPCTGRSAAAFQDAAIIFACCCVGLMAGSASRTNCRSTWGEILRESP